MGEDFEAEALKAQAVATYSWLLYNGAHEGNAPQVELKMASAEIIEAVNSVLGVCAYYDGKPAATYYHYCSAGNTASSQGVWGVSVPYLVSAPSSFDRNCEEYLNTNIYKASDIANWVRESAGIDLNKVTDRTKWFNVTYNGDYALSVRFGNDTQNFKAKYLREYIFTSERVGFSHALASQSYEITYRADNDTFVITTRGVGHGVGMSQYGANVLAKNGKNYKEILEHYYNGVVIK